MKTADRFKLLGTYTTPRVRKGRVLSCEARDADVIVTGFTDARIPWPKGRRKGANAVGPIVYGDLARAVRTESNQAVCYWFGITPQTVSKWRRLLGVEMTNPGTHRLRVEYGAEDWFADVRAKGQAVHVSPERRKLAGDRYRGKTREPHVIEAMRKGRVGKPHTEEARGKMREAQAARLATGWRPAGRAWTKAEDKLVETRPAAEVAATTGRTLKSVYARRVKLSLPDGRASNGRKPASDR